MSEPIYLHHTLRETLQMIADGHQTASIASIQGAPLETVKSRVKKLFRMYGARNRTHLVALAFRQGHLS